MLQVRVKAKKLKSQVDRKTSSQLQLLLIHLVLTWTTNTGWTCKPTRMGVYMMASSESSPADVHTAMAPERAVLTLALPPHPPTHPEKRSLVLLWGKPCKVFGQADRKVLQRCKHTGLKHQRCTEKGLLIYIEYTPLCCCPVLQAYIHYSQWWPILRYTGLHSSHGNPSLFDSQWNLSHHGNWLHGSQSENSLWSCCFSGLEW